MCIFRMGPKRVPRCYAPCEQCDKKKLHLHSDRPQARDQPPVIHPPFKSRQSNQSKKWCETCYKANLALCELDDIHFIHQCESALACSERITSAISMFAIDSEPHLTESNVKHLNTELYSFQKHLRGVRKCSCQIRSSESCKLLILLLVFDCGCLIICDSDCFCFLHR
jgi:hypothetical protein